MQPKVAELTIKIGGSNQPQSATIKAQKQARLQYGHHNRKQVI